MNEQALWLDGNALAGLLEELFATELTDAPRSCGSCGAARAVGAHRRYGSTLTVDGGRLAVRSACPIGR
jgi:hypothetical protein